MSADRLLPHERAALLGIARSAVRHRLGLGPAPDLPERGALAEERGAFVTLQAGGRLRGCIGTFAPRGSLARTVAAMAEAAATSDPRFEPVRCAEVDELDYHVSVLRAGRPVGGPAEIALGRDGLVVSQGWHRGVLLPRVARERGWDAETFLSQTCLKAGLPPDSWRSGDVAIRAFEAEEFGADPGE